MHTSHMMSHRTWFRALDQFVCFPYATCLLDSANQNMSHRVWYQRYLASITSVIQRIDTFTIPTCELVFLLNEVSSLLVAVRSLSAECGSVFADLALYLAVGGLCLGLVELSCSRSLSLSLSQARLLSARDSASLHLATELRSARGRASGHPRPSLFGHGCTVGVLARTHRCATESRVTLWQSANPCCVFVGVVTSCAPCALVFVIVHHARV